MARGTRTNYPGKRNKGLCLTFQPPEEGRGVQRPKYCDKRGDKDEDNSPKTVNNVHNTSSHKYRQTHYFSRFFSHKAKGAYCTRELNFNYFFFRPRSLLYSKVNYISCPN